MRRHRIHLGDDVRAIDFPIGSTVYLRTREDPVRGLVTGYQVTIHEIQYYVSWANSTGADGRHYAFELTAAFEPHFDHDHGAGPADGGATSDG